MKKRAVIIIAACMLILFAVGAVMLTGKGKKPYKDLDASAVRAAAVRLTPPGKTIRIADPEELVGYLNDVVIYQEDNSYTEYDGQGVTFTLTMNDGTQTCPLRPFSALFSAAPRSGRWRAAAPSPPGRYPCWAGAPEAAFGPVPWRPGPARCRSPRAILPLPPGS